MDPVLDRVRAANPASEDEFAGLHDFTALELEPPRRRRRRFLAVPALAAALAAAVVLPTSAPQASAIFEQAAEAASVDDGILYARSTYTVGTHTGAREVWVLGDEAMRWRGDDGAEEVYERGQGVTARAADGTITRRPESRPVPSEIFRISGLMERAHDVGLDETDTAYILRWREGPGVRTLWIDKQTSLPLRLTDRSPQSSYAEDILEFKTLPDTPVNRALLKLGPR